MKFHNLRELLLYISVLFFLSCKKMDIAKSVDEQAALSIQNLRSARLDKITKFLSITLNVPKEKVIYDYGRKEFLVLDTPLKFAYLSVMARYNEANEYKLNYE